MVKNLFWCSFFKDSSAIHEKYTIGNFSCKSHLMSYDNHCHTFLGKLFHNF